MFAPETSSPRPARASSACFNEAGACLPRKEDVVEQVRAYVSSFNEAGACLPRK